ncbi:MAG: ATP-binding cassette domain-containing protein [Desulfovibrio sp.]|uniref:ATP-binding cassette domain-containing protein n=1 Tax=Desulfovibrio sp. TaxID=885 RepID=UPI001A713A0A|nr:ATP-binding cassette domain-containing protein [Desulfovibrio sp.]MBD5417241.1 ATP-binding cassette domain-containing protein [Desulfovibrio sp.]
MPHGAVAVADMAFSFGETGILKDISFRVRPGTALAIIGPSGSGKSTLCKLLLGIWPASAGMIQLDGADIRSWDSEKLGAYLDYLPQDVDLFAGTVAENIARMGEVDAEQVVRAAQLAGVHELVLKLPKGYDTPIGTMDRGSPGGAAPAHRPCARPVRRALRDGAGRAQFQPGRGGEARLMQCLKRLRLAGKTVILVAHEPAVLAAMDEILVLDEGGRI